MKTFLSSTQISDAEFQKSLIVDINDFLLREREQSSRLCCIHSAPKEKVVDILIEICPQAKSFIIFAADKVCKHCFDLLGSGITDLGWPIDWHADFKTGFRWNPKQYFSNIRPARYPGGYELKFPWELSRCQHFAWLGQAYWLTGDEKYPLEFRWEVEDWIKQNPPEFGVNWACSMDIAIRAVNWLLGYAFFQHSAILEDDFRVLFFKSLLSHGRHILANLEKTATFTGNHYLSDIVGLVYLGILLPEFKEAQHWREFGLKELENEMFKQVYPDGGNFEASTSYHRLVTELFLSTTVLAVDNGHFFSEEYTSRLEKMLDFIYQFTKPDGTAPIIGDQDNGKLHRLKVWEESGREWKDFRPLLAVGSVFFNRTDWGKAAAEHWEDAIWLFGDRAAEAYRQMLEAPEDKRTSVGFEDSGLYILRAEDIHIAVELGPIGQNGRGGHAHNDSLSFELFASGQTWIQDPGTYVYTQDYVARNLFRSTEFHNTLVLPGYEQNRFDAVSLFRMKEESTSRIRSWQVETGGNTRLEGDVEYLKQPGVKHCRSFYLSQSEHALLLVDQVEGELASLCRLMFHFAPGLELYLVQNPYAGIQIISPDGKVAWLFSISNGQAKIQLQDGWISESYGVRVPAPVATIEFQAGQKQTTVILLPGSLDIHSRIQNLIQDESLSY